MLYIFDLGNVIVDIDFNRVLGVWSDLSRVPFATLKERLQIGETFAKHERGEIEDELFAATLCDELDIGLSYEQFCAGWQAMFIDVRRDTITVMQQLRERGSRVVILSNTNCLHSGYWRKHYPHIEQSADQLYLSHEMGVRKPDVAIYLRVLRQEGLSARQAVFFDDSLTNVQAAQALGINSIHVNDAGAVTAWFAMH